MKYIKYGIIVFGLAGLALGIGGMTGCTVNQNDAMRILRQQGINNPSLDGYAFFGCSASDDFSTKFHGMKNGLPVSGTVCGGFLKDYTIRYE